MKRILLVTGSYPPEVCGVGDYSYNLLQANPEIFELYYSKKWKIRDLYHHIKSIRKSESDIVNIQYPTLGYGWSIVPHLLAVYFSIFSNKVLSVTIHELSQSSFKAKCALFFVLLIANRLIFTNEYEREFAESLAWRVKRRSCIIKILSNIPVASPTKPIESRQYDVGYFGLIRPNKGLESVMCRWRKCKACSKVIIGKVPTGMEDYAREISEKCTNMGIELYLNLSLEEVSCLIKDIRIMCLPFPDGASERRGSMLAAFLNGAVVMSTVGIYTSDALLEAIIDIDEHDIMAVLNDENVLSNKQRQAFLYMKENIPDSWEEIGRRYRNFLYLK